MKASPNEKTRNQTPPAAGPVSRYQTFEAVTLARSEILNVPYNPRRISAAQKEKLRAGVERFGYVGGMVWNRRNKHLVGGAQRLAVLDDLHGGEPYSVTVGAVNLDERDEKKLNVLLNNPNAQGSYDEAKLKDLILSIEQDLDGTRFDAAELEALLTEVEADLKKVTVQTPPKMAWVLIGVPLVQFASVNAQIESLAQVPGVLIESTVNDDEQKDAR